MPSIEDQITELWGQITAATHRFLVLIAEFDSAQGWKGTGMVSCAQWLNLHCGIGEVAAREKLRVAHAIRNLPQIDAAFRDGRVSYSKVRAMTRVATPDNEPTLLNIALHGTASHVERTVRQFRRLERIEEAAAAANKHRRRAVYFRREDDDTVSIAARLPAEIGELVRLAIERAAELVEGDSCCEPDEPDHTFDATARRRAEGLRILAERFLADASKEAGAASSERYQVVVHIDQSLLADQPSARAADCSIEDGPALAVETARRLACDASLVGIAEDADGTPLNIGRRTRAIPTSIQRALKSRDGGCRFPGCTHTRFTEGHHIEHWANGGETRLSNLVTLCHFHHHLVHEGGFRVECIGDGALLFTRPDGSLLPDHVPARECFRGNILGQINGATGIRVDARTIRSRWQGERMDYSLAIDALLAARAGSRDYMRQ